MATKVGNRVGPDQRRRRVEEHIIDSCEASLRRLQTDYIDVYQIHSPDRDTPQEETLERAERAHPAGQGALYRAARITSTGKSSKRPGSPEQRGLQGFISCQDFYNLLYRDIEKRMLPMCVKYGPGTDPLPATCRALLSGSYRRNVRPRAGQSRRDSADLQVLGQRSQLDRAGGAGWHSPSSGAGHCRGHVDCLAAQPAAGPDSHRRRRPPRAHQRERSGPRHHLQPEDLLEIDRLTLVDEDRTIAPVLRRVQLDSA